MQKYNINTQVKVQLTPVGQKVYLDFCKQHYQQLPAIIPNYYKGELWYLMRIFGNEQRLGGSQHFVNNLIEFLEDE